MSLKLMRQLLIFIFVILMQMFASLAYANTGRLYTSNELTCNQIKVVVQDKYGFIWVGTNYGLNRFDGYTFTSYLCNPNDPTSIQDNGIVRLLPYDKESMYVATNNGLYRYSYSNNSFELIPIPGRSEKIRVSELVEDKQHNILIGTAGYGVYKLDVATGAVIKLDKPFANSIDNFYSHMYFDAQGYLWQFNHTDIFRKYKYDGKHIKLVKQYTIQGTYGFHNPFARDQHGFFVVIGTGVLRYDYAKARFSKYDLDFSEAHKSSLISSSFFDKHGNLWIGSAGSGAFMVPRGSRKVHKVGQNTNSFYFGNAHVSEIFVDKDGNQWFGCYKKGLFLLNEDKDVFRSVSLTDMGAGMETVSSMVGIGQDLVLFVVRNYGLFLLNVRTGETQKLNCPDNPSLLALDQQKNIYVYANNGIYAYDLSSQSFHLMLRTEGKSFDGIVFDNRGYYYMKSAGNGLYVYNSKTQKYAQYMMDEKRPYGTVCNNWITDMRLDSKGLLWCATVYGVSCLDTKTMRFDTAIPHTLLKGKVCLSTIEMKDGNVAIATEMGLYLYHPKTRKLESFPHSESIQGLRIFSLHLDAIGNLWMSSAQGICCYDAKAKAFISFTRGNGLITREYLEAADAMAGNGAICYAHSDGLTYFYPSEVREKDGKLGNVFLSGVLADGGAMSIASDEIEVPSDCKSVVMTFSLFDYRGMDNVVFQYRINGGAWISNPAGDNSFNFTGLSYGHYRIEVRAYSNGKYSLSSKVIELEVQTPWYVSLWAILLYILLAMMIIAGCIYVYLRKKKSDLEEAKMQFLINATHDIRSPLTLIMEPLKKLKEHLKDDVESKDDIDTIDRNAQRLLTLVNQILDKRRIDKHQMNLHCRETNLVDYTQGLVSLYAYNANLRGIQVILDMPEKPVKVWIDRNKLDKAIANLLSNAFKYTPNGGEIIVRINQDDDKKVRLYVIDSGRGFAGKADTSKLFDRFYQGGNSTDMHLGGSGIGLNLCRSIVRLHGGEVYAENRTDGKSGACFTIELLKGKAHLTSDQLYQEEGKETAEVKSKRASANRNYKILLVDDDIEICRYIKTELSDWYRFVICNNGKEALKQLLSTQFDLVISDVVMPEMDGITLLKNIKSNANVSDVPVIMLTSKSEIADRLEGLKLGADAYIAKPFSLEELHVTIDNLVDNVRRLRGKFSGALKQEDKVEKVSMKGYDEDLMERIMKSVNANLDDSDFSVEKLCEDVGISRTQLHRKLKEMTGVSTAEFIRNIRLNEAARLIRERKVNPTQVAYAVGFVNYSHFSTTFRKHFGVSPSDYEAKYGEGNGDTEKSDK